MSIPDVGLPDDWTRRAYVGLTASTGQLSGMFSISDGYLTNFILLLLLLQLLHLPLHLLLHTGLASPYTTTTSTATTPTTDNHDVISLATYSTEETMEKALSDSEILIGAGEKLKPLFDPAPQGMILAERLTRY